MATDPSASPSTSLVDRVKNILTQPKAEWPRIEAEPATIAGIYRNYVVILAAIGPICTFIGFSLIGGGFFRFSTSYLIGQAITSYVLMLVAVYVLALIIDALAPSFGGVKNQLSAFKVAAYSLTAAWVAGAFAIFPPLAILILLAGLYGIYLFYLGLPVLMKVTADKAVIYTAVVVVAWIVIYFVMGAVTHALLAAMMPAPVSSVTFAFPSR